MLLKTLEMHGFKSFADKTKLEFHEGVTGIVGPNGCGKSNIVDAMRWVLGETSAKALRGGEMADVIFNGTDKRSPLGLAEVTLTLTDCAKSLETDYDEVAIGRRVYRDGKSEYLINQAPCRLKDVHDLLMGTGIGRTSYSIMEQGKIDMLLSSKPEDRRAVFEEAAGITKFKQQKKEALRKLDYTEANLVRVRDIIAEEERQIRSLSRQASKAKRFQILQEEVRVLDLHHSHRLWRELRAGGAEMSTSSHNLRVDQDALEEDIETKQTEMASARFEHQELESRLSELQGQIAHIDNEVDTAKNRIEFNGERAHEQSILIKKNEEDIEVTSSKMSLQREELQTTNETLIHVATRITEQEEILHKYEAETLQARGNREKLAAEIRESEIERSSLKTTIATLTAQLASNSMQFDTDKSRLLELTDELGKLQRELDHRQNDADELKRRIGEHDESILFHEEELNGMEQRYRQAKSAAMERLEDLSNLHKLNAEKVSRLDVLEQLVEEGEGFAKGTQAVLKGRIQDPGIKDGAIRKPLYSYIDTDDRFASAIEAALGNQLQTVVVHGMEVAEKVIDALKRDMLGKASLIAADHLVKTNGSKRGLAPKEAICWAIDAVTPEKEVETLMEQLLGDVLIADNLRIAMELRQKMPKKAVATLNGEYISKEGVIHGGASGDDSGSFLKRQTEIRNLSKVTVSLHSEVEKMQQRRDELNNRVSQLESALENARAKLQDKRVAVSTLAGDLSVVEKDLTIFHNKIDSIKWEQKQIEDRGVTLESSMLSGREQLDLSNSRISSIDQNIDRAISLLEEAREREEELNKLVTEARTSLAVEKGSQENLQNQQIPMSNRLKELEDLIVRRREETEDYKGRIKKGAEETAALQKTIEEREAEKAEKVEMQKRLVEERSTYLSRIEKSEAELTEKRKLVQEIAERRNKEELQVSQYEIHVENLENNIRERYQAELEFFEPDSHQLLTVINQQKKAKGLPIDQPAAETMLAEADTPADNGDEDMAVSVNALTSEAGEEIIEEIADGETEFTDPSEPDWPFVEEVVSGLRSKLDAMGPVNLDAIAEYEELEERYNFNLRELTDLENAKEELLKLVARINRDTRKMFSDTFAQVRINFREMFKELFGEKAKSDLVLLDDEDPLEAGIEVIAKPPGKKLQSISLLSGGERSMTAVALLFAIFMVKPSPFCVLDELDAPLDEANISRFIRVLDRFIGNSQFVIVTHSKRTMSRADVMYGVSMEEFGVSKTVGVKFSKADEAIGLKAAPVGG
ncbi:MAG: chromosome segregation protein SMC [Verrucomicrobiales bacterium]|nr:chromosome segregation protein SMC [Verrucomicrobiales bacterium]